MIDYYERKMKWTEEKLKTYPIDKLYHKLERLCRYQHVTNDAPAPLSTVFILLLADFKTKYMEETILGKGGFGSVYAGFRNIDNLPVRLTRIKRTINQTYTQNNDASSFYLISKLNKNLFSVL